VSGRLLKGWTTEQAFDLEALPEGHPPGQAKEILVQGKRFYSLSEASRHYRLKDSTVSARMRAGWSIEQAVGLLPPPKPKPHGKAVVVEGIRFPNLVAAANHYGVSSSLASDRLIKGWSNEEAFSIVPRLAPTRYGTIIKVNGLVFESVQAACKHFKVPYPTYKGRKKKGYTVKQALGLVEVKRINPVARPIMVKTIQYPSLKKACQAYKLPHSRVQARLSAGWTINEAFDLAPRKKVASQGTELKIKGRLFPSIKAACMYYGVSYPTFSVRRRSGYSVEESLINFRKKLPPNSKSITLKGKKYLSIADACRKLGLPRARVNSRLARGASTRQAFKEIYTP
jgi:hypothetical protein